MDKPKFLQKVKVKNFAEIRKGYKMRQRGDRDNFREVVKRENRNPEQIFTVIGVTTMKEGWSDYIGYEEGYAFEQTASKTVYIVANTLGRRYKALLEDLELIEGESHE